ncbi:hypothetical protein AB0F91_27135 [Amycolatopsis sp. NPDC023774]|uniref:SLAC1 family transporter n=1 Tax=Amycolatopsis sp. NPDC023774 TaxID=3155015 RepID=UPI0033F522FF
MPRIVPNAFGMGFGLAGLAGTWRAAADAGLAPRWIGDVLLVLTALVWVTVLLAYGVHALSHSGMLRSDLTHPVLAPFLSLAVITPMVLAARGVEPHMHTTGKVLTDVLIGLVFLHGCWFTGQLIYGEYSFDQLHPGYFLPTVAGGLVASASAAQVGQEGLGRVLFGYGVVCWVILGSMILGRLFFRPALPAALLPTLAIEVAPAPVASLAWFELGDGSIDFVAQFLAGYGALMVLAQLRLLPAFRKLSFSIGFWSFTFAWAAVATAMLDWIAATRPAWQDVWSWLVLAVITLLVGGIAVRTVVALARGQLFVARPQRTPAPQT